MFFNMLLLIIINNKEFKNMLNDDKIINDKFDDLLLDDDLLDTLIDDLEIIERIKQNNNIGDNNND
jgi:hypothetical protein